MIITKNIYNLNKLFLLFYLKNFLNKNELNISFFDKFISNYTLFIILWNLYKFFSTIDNLDTKTLVLIIMITIIMLVYI